MVLKAFFIVVRLSNDILDPENQLGSGFGKIRRDPDACHQKYNNTKDDFWNYLKYSSNIILKISSLSRYRALDPNLSKNRIRNSD